MLNPDRSRASERTFIVQFTQRNIRNTHLVRIGLRDHTQPEDLEPVRRGHAIQIFIDGAHEHLPPIALYRGFCLALLMQPVEHADAIEIGAPEALLRNRADRTRDSDLVRHAEEFQLYERSEKVRGSGKHAAFEDGRAPAGFDEAKFTMESDFAFNTEPPVEVQQIDATAQQDVLAVVDHLPILPTHGPRSRAAAEEVAR